MGNCYYAHDELSRTLFPWTRRQWLQQLESSFLTGLAMPFSRDSKSHLSRDKIEFQNISFQSIGGIQI